MRADYLTTALKKKQKKSKFQTVFLNCSSRNAYTRPSFTFTVLYSVTIGLVANENENLGIWRNRFCGLTREKTADTMGSMKENGNGMAYGVVETPPKKRRRKASGSGTKSPAKTETREKPKGLAAVIKRFLKLERPEEPETAAQGEWGEAVARAYLEKEEHLRCVGSRVRIRKDEIDLVMEPRGGSEPSVVFVEVKTRSSDLFGGGRASVDRRKRRALCRAAVAYLRKKPPMPFRIDIVEIYGDHTLNLVDRIVHHKAAVPLPARIQPRGIARKGTR